MRSGITERRDATRRVEGRKEAEAGDRRKNAGTAGARRRDIKKQVLST